MAARWTSLSSGRACDAEDEKGDVVVSLTERDEALEGLVDVVGDRFCCACGACCCADDLNEVAGVEAVGRVQISDAVGVEDDDVARVERPCVGGEPDLVEKAEQRSWAADLG